MSIDHWCNINYQSLLQASKNISYNDPLAEELLHYSLEALLTKPNVQEIIDSGGANFWCIRVMMNSWRSTTSAFFKLYRGTFEQISLYTYLEENDIAEEEVENIEELATKIKVELEKLYWYEKQLFELYAQSDHTISSLARETKIPRTSISLTVNRVRNHIKQKITPKA